MTKFIFVTGGVSSSLGKGILTSSLGALLKARGYSVNIVKCDPYLNIDAGTMSPIEHGEVFVTQDGAETDLDLGNYERYLNISLSQNNNITTGKVYRNVLAKERKGDYLGKTVQIVPHVTNEIKAMILSCSNIDSDVKKSQKRNSIRCNTGEPILLRSMVLMDSRKQEKAERKDTADSFDRENKCTQTNFMTDYESQLNVNNVEGDDMRQLKYDIVLIEIGGTVGDIESQPFLEAQTQMIMEYGKENCLS